MKGWSGQEGNGREPDGGRGSGDQEGQMPMEGGDGRRDRWQLWGGGGRRRVAGGRSSKWGSKGPDWGVGGS